MSAIAGEEVVGVATVTATAWGVQGGALNKLKGEGKRRGDSRNSEKTFPPSTGSQNKQAGRAR